MRLKSAIWVAAYIRRCHVEGAYAVVRRRGAEEAGAIFIKLNRLDGTAELFGPAPQSAFDEARPTDRAFSACVSARQPAPEAEVEERLAREIRFDPDIWIVEVEDRAGRHFLDRSSPDAGSWTTVKQEIRRNRLRQPDRHAAGHSNILSELKSTDVGNLRSSSLAVLTLANISNFVGRSTGKVAGAAPLRILST